MATSAPASVPSGQVRRHSSIRRRRPSYSCELCRSRRVKCDQTQPKCSNCVERDVNCMYREMNLKRKGLPDEHVKNESPTKAVRRNSEGEKQYNQGYLLLQSGGRSRYIENTFWACADVEGLELDSLLFDLPLFPLEDTCWSAAQDTKNDTHNIPCHHYIGTTEPNYSFWAARRPTSLTADTHSLASSLSGLPPKEVSDAFYKDFVDSVHPLIPLIHLPTFDSYYHRFWDWYKTWIPGCTPEGVLAENPGFLPLLATVLFTGSIARPRPATVANMCPPLETQNKLYRLIPATLAMVGFPHSPSLYSLMAFILHRSMLIREEESLSSCSFVAVAFRVCQAMGLHKDGTDFGLDDIQVEERRRVWCHLMHLDVMTSIVSGLPLVASSEMFSNTRPILELKDNYIGKRQKGYVDTDPAVDLNYIITAGRYDSTSCIRSILLRQFSPRPVTLACIESFESEIGDLQTRIENRIERIALQARQDLGEESNPRVCWGKDLLHLMIEKSYCLLYQPTMRDSDLWKELRHRAIPHFQSFLSIFIDMCSTESYLPYQWLYPGAYQPLQPVAALLIDLLNNPRSRESAKSSGLLEKIFSMLGPEGRITNGVSSVNCWDDQRHTSTGAKQAWVRLEKLRSRVWNKLGLDHTVLWMRSIKNNAPQSGNASTADNSIPGKALIQLPIPLQHDRGLDASVPLGEPESSILISTDADVGASNGIYFPLQDNHIPALSDVEQAFGAPLQTLGLQFNSEAAGPPFSNINYQR